MARRAVLALASHTGWSKGEILDMDVDELVDWVNTLEAMRPKT